MLKKPEENMRLGKSLLLGAESVSVTDAEDILPPLKVCAWIKNVKGTKEESLEKKKQIGQLWQM